MFGIVSKLFAKRRRGWGKSFGRGAQRSMGAQAPENSKKGQERSDFRQENAKERSGKKFPQNLKKALDKGQVLW